MFSLRLAEHKRILIAVDFILVELTTLVAFWIMAFRAEWVFDARYLTNYAGWFVFLPGLWFLSAFLNGLYDPATITDLGKSARCLLRAIALVIVVYLTIYFFFATPGEMPRGIVGYQGAASFIAITLWRAFYFTLARRRSFARKVIVVGAGWAGQTIAQTIHSHARAHYQMIGFVDDDSAKQQYPITVSANLQLPVLGPARDLARFVKEYQVPEIVLAVTRDLSASLFQALLECKEQGVQITLMPVLFEQLTGMVPLEHIGDNWNITLPLDSAEASGFYLLAKRAFDLIGALIGLTLYLPLLPLIALAIKLDSPGPIFLWQTRVGKGGKIFRLLKLRTMVADAEPDGHAVRAQKSDPRITRVGRWLRKTRLDEMPQLFNILKGEMSAVGPRPERPEHLIELDREIPFHRLRNAVKPGMAGWAVANYDYIDSLADAKMRLQYDLYYIKHQSLSLDLLVLWRTFGQMLALRGR
ncbi:MAG: sugar transferase [Anaerolineales bacterium]|nr:sugar transferase [Anaerolineales bacterium]